jgi:hypothetical protein
MIGRLRIMGVAMAATAALSGVISASAAPRTLAVNSLGPCVSQTSAGGGSFGVHLTCATTANTNTAPTPETVGYLDLDVRWTSGGACPPSHPQQMWIAYNDAYGGEWSINGTSNWSLTTDPTNLVSECQMTLGATDLATWVAVPGSTAAGGNIYNGLTKVTNFNATIPAISAPIPGEATNFAVAISFSS